MSTPEAHWWSVRAGEYVLGTLRGKDLALFEKILRHDTSLQQEVAQWEQWFYPLNDTEHERSSDVDLFPLILHRISQLDTERRDQGRKPRFSDRTLERNTNGAGSDPEIKSAATGRFSTARIWPAVASLATAACVVLSILLFQKHQLPTYQEGLNVDGVAVVLSDEDGVPYFLVETDYQNQQVRVTTLSAPKIEDNQDFKLWQALPDRSAVRPVALLSEKPGTSQVFTINNLIVGSDLFGVSVEPDGNEGIDSPTGPVVAHGDFLPVSVRTP